MKRLIQAIVLMLLVGKAAAGGYPLFVEAKKEEDGVWAILAHNAGPAPVYISIGLKDRVNVRVGGLSSAGQKSLEPGARETILLAIAENPEEKMSFQYETKWVFGRGVTRSEHTGIYRAPFPGDLTFETNNSSGEEPRSGRMLNSLDILMPEGTPVIAARSGYVMDVAGERDGDKVKGAHPYYEDPTSLGSYVRIVHEDGTWSEYAHLKAGTVVVKAGQRIEAGTQIAESGSTGKVLRPHLGFTIFKPQQGFLEPISLPIRMDLPGRGHVTVKAGDTLGATFAVAPEPETTRNDPLVIAAVTKAKASDKAGVYSSGMSAGQKKAAQLGAMAVVLAIALFAGVVWLFRRKKQAGTWKQVWASLRSPKLAKEDVDAPLGADQSGADPWGRPPSESTTELNLRPKKGYMLADWEGSFYSGISLAMPMGYSMHAKVSLNRLVSRPLSDCKTRQAAAILRGSSVDALIVRDRDGRIAVALDIERDYDAMPAYQEAEEAKRALLQVAGIKVLVVRRDIGPAELKELIERLAPNEMNDLSTSFGRLRAA